MFRPQPHPRANDSNALHLDPDVVFGYSRARTSRYLNWRYRELVLLFSCRLGGVAPGEKSPMVEQTSMEESFDRAGPDLDEEEAHEVKALIR
jgi:hypothetical protein